MVDAGFWVGDAATWIGMSFDTNVLAYTSPPGTGEPGFPIPSLGSSCTGCYAHGIDPNAGFPLDNTGQPFYFILASQDAAAPWFGANVANAAVVCEREPVGIYGHFCSGGICFDLPSVGKSYIVGPNATDPDEARAICEAQNDAGGSGHLLMIDSADERDFIATELARDLALGDSPGFWVGLSHDDDAGTWRWDDKQQRTIPWGDEAPETTFAKPNVRAFMRLSPDFYDPRLLHAKDDQTSLPFICQLTKK
jgi:hypothetical protein